MKLIVFLLLSILTFFRSPNRALSADGMVPQHAFSSMTIATNPVIDNYYVTISSPISKKIHIQPNETRLTDIEPGVYTIVVEGGEYIGSASINVPIGASVRCVVQLQPSNSTTSFVSGQLTEPRSGEPVRGFSIVSSSGRSTTTAEDGSFVFVNHAVGEFTFTAQLNDSTFSAYRVDVLPNVKKLLPMRLGIKYSLPVVTDGLIAFYPFDQADITDCGIHKTHGKNIDAIAVADRNAHSHSALGFDGQNRAEIPDAPWQHELPFSISFWLKVDATSPVYGMLISKYLYPVLDGWSVYISEGALVFAVMTPKNTAYILQSLNAGVRDGQWHHYVITISELGFSMFVDGISGPAPIWALGSPPLNPPTTNEPIYLGQLLTDDPTYGQFNTGFVGAIDDLAFYNKVLTDEEIAELGK